METLRTISILRSVLSQEIGWSWPVFLIRCLIESSALYRKTGWAAPSAPAEEARYTRRFAPAAAIYVKLKEKQGREKALAAMRRILLPIGEASNWAFFNSLDLSGTSGIDRFMAFKTRMQETAEDRFNQREYIIVNDQICHYVIRRCVVYDFFSATGTPELTRFICQADQEFFPAAFPDLDFSRGDSWENTIAYGKNHCEYVLKKKI